MRKLKQDLPGLKAMEMVWKNVLTRYVKKYKSIPYLIQITGILKPGITSDTETYVYLFFVIYFNFAFRFIIFRSTKELFLLNIYNLML